MQQPAHAPRHAGEVQVRGHRRRARWPRTRSSAAAPPSAAPVDRLATYPGSHWLDGKTVIGLHRVQKSPMLALNLTLYRAGTLATPPPPRHSVAPRSPHDINRSVQLNAVVARMTAGGCQYIHKTVWVGAHLVGHELGKVEVDDDALPHTSLQQPGVLSSPCPAPGAPVRRGATHRS